MTEAEKKPRRAPKPLKLDAITIDAKVTPEHFARWEPTIRAVTAGELVAANVNVTRAVTVALGAYVNLAASRDDILATVANFRRAALDDLPALAHAAWHADLLQRVAEDPTRSCADLMPEVEEVRELLLAQAKTQVLRKRFPSSVVEAVIPGSGIEDRANDLSMLTQAFRKQWKTLKAHVDLTEAELDRADDLAAQLMARLGARAVVARAEGELTSAEVRARAFTLLWRAYEECRRGACATWWYEPGGWEQYVPSLRAGQGGSGRQGATEPEPTPAPAPHPT